MNFELPSDIKNQIADYLFTFSKTKLLSIASSISNKYLNSDIDRGIKNETEAYVYAALRSNATNNALYFSLKETLSLYNAECDSILDVGCGLGFSYYVCGSLLNNFVYTGIEIQDSMIEVNKKLNRNANLNIIKGNILSIDMPKSDLIIASYCLNELEENKLLDVVDKLYASTNKILLIVEPGTKKGYEEIIKIKNYLVDKDATIIAPCPYKNGCPIIDNDWCHFSIRINREKINKLVKDGEVPYEDEKFIYLAVTPNKINISNYYRVRRHPLINKGYVDLSICSSNGIENKRINKKDSLYKLSRKIKWGERY